MHSHRNTITDNKTSENAPVNIFYVKWDIYFHFKKGIQSTISTCNCNCKHIIRNCNNALNVKKPHLLPKLLFAARIVPFCILPKKKDLGSFSVLDSSWEKTACIHMFRHSSSRKQSGYSPPATWRWLLYFNPWRVFRHCLFGYYLTKTKTMAESIYTSQNDHRMVPKTLSWFSLLGETHR